MFRSVYRCGWFWLVGLFGLQQLNTVCIGKDWTTKPKRDEGVELLVTQRGEIISSSLWREWRKSGPCRAVCGGGWRCRKATNLFQVEVHPSSEGPLLHPLPLNWNTETRRGWEAAGTWRTRTWVKNHDRTRRSKQQQTQVPYLLAYK